MKPEHASRVCSGDERSCLARLCRPSVLYTTHECHSGCVLNTCVQHPVTACGDGGRSLTEPHTVSSYLDMAGPHLVGKPMQPPGLLLGCTADQGVVYCRGSRPGTARLGAGGGLHGMHACSRLNDDEVGLSAISCFGSQEGMPCLLYVKPPWLLRAPVLMLR
jgi:hypothetical protein